MRKRPIHQGAWCIEAEITIVEASDCDAISSLASTFGDTAILLDTTPYFFDGNGGDLELINPSTVFKEIEKLGHPGVRSIVGFSINRSALRPGEEKFLAFYLGKIVPACIGSNERGQQKRLRKSCIKALYGNEELLDFIRNVVLPGKDLTKPGAIKQLFNGTFSTRTIELDLEELRMEGIIPPRDTTPESTSPSTKKGKDREKNEDRSNGEDVYEEEDNEKPRGDNDTPPPRTTFLDPDKEDDNAPTKRVLQNR